MDNTNFFLTPYSLGNFSHMTAYRWFSEYTRKMNLQPLLTPKNLDVFLVKMASNQPLLKTR
jgi:hypothetical protein